MINGLLEEEVTQKAGARNRREKPYDGRYSRWGFNPGSLRIRDLKLKEFESRSLDHLQVIALFIDGKYLSMDSSGFAQD